MGDYGYYYFSRENPEYTAYLKMSFHERKQMRINGTVPERWIK